MLIQVDLYNPVPMENLQFQQQPTEVASHITQTVSAANYFKFGGQKCICKHYHTQISGFLCLRVYMYNLKLKQTDRNFISDSRPN